MCVPVFVCPVCMAVLSVHCPGWDAHIKEKFHQGVSSELAIVFDHLVPLEDVDTVLLSEAWDRELWGLEGWGCWQILEGPSQGH